MKISQHLFALILLLLVVSTILIYKLKDQKENKTFTETARKKFASIPEITSKDNPANQTSSSRSEDISHFNAVTTSESIAMIREFFNAIRNKDSAKEQRLLPVVSGLRGKEVTKEIINQLKGTHDIRAQFAAITLLGGMPDVNKMAINALLDLLNSNEDTDLRKHAIKVLASKQDEKVIQVLSDAMEKDPNKWIRFESAWSLALIKDKKALPGLFKVLETEQDKLTLDKIIWAVGEIANKDAINQLLEISYKTQRKEVQEGVRTILARLDSGTVYGSLVNMLSSHDPEEQKSALRSLASMPDKEVYPLFETVLRYGQNPDVRREALELMSYMKDKGKNLELFSVALTFEQDTAIRIKAVKGLTQLQGVNEKVVPILTGIMMYDKNLSVRREAINAMASGGYKLEEVSPKLIEVVRYDLNPYAQLDAIRTLKVLSESQKKHEEIASFFDRETVPILKQMVSSSDKEESVKSYALMIMGMIGNDEVIPFLEYVQSTTKSEKVQKSALTAIEKIKKLSERR